MSQRTVPGFPTKTKSVEDATPGPDFGAGPTYPGDMFLISDGEIAVLTSTRVGGTGNGIEAFDPRSASHREIRANELETITAEWTQIRKNLGYGTIVGEADQTQYVFLATFDLERDQYLCESGATRLGAVSTQFDECVISANSISDFLGSLDRLVSTSMGTGFDSLPEKIRTQFVDEFTADVEAIAEKRLADSDPVVSATEFFREDVSIPVASPEPVVKCSDMVFHPGDRFISWGNGEEEGMEMATNNLDISAVPYGQLAEGNCDVIVKSELPASPSPDNDSDASSSTDESYGIVDLFTGSMHAATAGGVERRYRRARQTGVVLRMIGRDCFVDPVEADETVTIHCYHYEMGPETGFMLASDRLDTTTPRLEHPLSLFVETFHTQDELTTALRNYNELTGPLGEWAETDPRVAQRCRQLADHVDEVANGRDIGSKGYDE